MKDSLRTQFEHLCSPAQMYFVIAVVGIILGIITRLVSPVKGDKIAFATYLISIFFISLWTWILNLMCKDGYSKLSWALVLFPYFLILAIVICSMIGGITSPDLVILGIYAAVIIAIGMSMMKK